MKPKKKPVKKPEQVKKPTKKVKRAPFALGMASTQPKITYVAPVPPKPPVPETCMDCRFSHIISGQHDLVCRRFPPMSFTGTEYATWPVVRLTDWCGEWK